MRMEHVLACDTQDSAPYQFAEAQAFELANGFGIRPIARFAATTVIVNELGDFYELHKGADHTWDGTNSVIEMFMTDVGWAPWIIAKVRGSRGASSPSRVRRPLRYSTRRMDR
jgi:hypothetical protein